MMKLATVLILFAGASAFRVQLGMQERPVMKVVRLLQDMKDELNQELEDDQAVHEKMTCWCDSGSQEKTAAIEMGEAKSVQLQSTMDGAIAKISELKATRKDTQEEQYANEKALGEATELRFKESKAFHQEDKDYTEAIMASKNAVIALSKHHPEFAQVKAAAQKLQSAPLSALKMNSQQLAALKDFLTQTQSASSLLQIPGMQSYAPQSGQIFGILKQMAEDFETDLATSTKTEAKSKAEYEELKAAKEEEIAAGKMAIVQLDGQLADFGEKHAQAMKELEDTQAQLALDEEFLKTLKSKCAASASDFEKRMGARNEEIAAVEDTIKMINNDAAFANFGKTVDGKRDGGSIIAADTFLQVRSVSSSKAIRKQVSTLLQQAAGRTGMPQLALLAASVQLDEFQKVKAEIDKLISELNTQQKDEVDKRDWCHDELAENDRSTASADDKKENLVTKKADLEKTIAKLTADIKSTTQAVADLQAQMKKLSEVREAENADFQQTITDQRLTQIILTKALDRMKEVYLFLQGPGAAHIATSGTHTDPGNGPARFTKYEQNAGGSRVVSMIEQVIADSKKTELDAIVSEEDSQQAYENFMKDSNKSIIASAESLVNMNEALAQSKESLTMTKSDLTMTLSELENLNNEKGDLHKSCDFVLDNFEARQAARAAEVDALKEAKAILSGM